MTSNDVLVGANELNRRTLIDEFGQLPDRSGFPADFRPLYDRSGDGVLAAAADLLPIINLLNEQAGGEGPSLSQVWADGVDLVFREWRHTSRERPDRDTSFGLAGVAATSPDPEYGRALPPWRPWFLG